MMKAAGCPTIQATLLAKSVNRRSISVSLLRRAELARTRLFPSCGSGERRHRLDQALFERPLVARAKPLARRAGARGKRFVAVKPGEIRAEARRIERAERDMAAQPLARDRAAVN